MKPTLEQIQREKEWYVSEQEESEGSIDHSAAIYALELAEQVALGEVVVVPKLPSMFILCEGIANFSWQESASLAMAKAYVAMINAAQPPQEASDERD